MHARAAQLIEELGLVPHPEGGHYREVHRANGRVHPGDGRSERSALTVIYFLLTTGDVSRWHRVASDEVWQHVEGAPVFLMTAEAASGPVERRVLGPLAETSAPVRVVPANVWQAAQCLGPYALVACAVGPGFDFADFVMLRDLPEDAARLSREQPAFASYL